MRIAFFHHYSLTHGGGGERFLVELANYLVSRGHQVAIHAFPFRRREASFELAPGVTYCESLVHHEKADVAYYMYAPLAHFAFAFRGPKIAGLHGAVVADYRSPAAFYIRQGPFVAGAYMARQTIGPLDLTRFDAVHTVSPLPLAHRRVYTLPNWVDRSNTSRALDAKRTRPERFAVLYVGKPSYTKGFDFLTALSRQMSGDGIEFWVASPPDPELQHSPGLRWVGYVPHDEMWHLYASASVLLHPSRQETFGRAILESVAAGTPVVTTPIPSHRSMDLPLRYASTLPEMQAQIEELRARWQSDYPGYCRDAESLASSVARFDRNVLLPQYERMLAEVASGAGS